MAKIKIKDLPKDIKVSKEEAEKALGGESFARSYSVPLASLKNLRDYELLSRRFVMDDM